MTKDNITLDNDLKEAIIEILNKSVFTIHAGQLEVEAVQVKKVFDESGERQDCCMIDGFYSQGLRKDYRDRIKKVIEENDYIDICKNFEEDNFICETKGKSGEDSAEESKYLLILVCLDLEIINYKEIIRYILKRFLTEVRHYNEFKFIEDKSERFEYFFGSMQKRRILLGDYVEFYLQKKKLPDAEILTELSAAKYEGSDSEARIYFDLSSVKEACAFDDGGKESRVICSSKLRLIRKLMEIAKKDRLYLYAERTENDEFVISKLIEKDNDAVQGTYIKFSGFMHWSIVCNAKEEISYYHGQYLLNASEKDTLHSAKIKEILNKLPDEWKSEMGKCYEESSWNKLVEILRKQRHGTSVILTNCTDKVDDLCSKNRGIRLSECEGFCWDEEREGWNEERILSVTGIDGALFLDMKGNCLAIGVLVDGAATIPGNVGRGARYNSIVNYVMQKEEGFYIGIIVSEDGMVDIVCNKIDETSDRT